MELDELLGSLSLRIHSAGWPFIVVAAGASAGLALFSGPLGVLGAIVTLWLTYFFRDPERVTPVRDGLVVSPADGRVQMITHAAPPRELGIDRKSVV